MDNKATLSLDNLTEFLPKRISMNSFEALFRTGNIGDTTVKNRLFMAPLTRNRANSNGTPKDMAIEYYRQRAGAGLIISEATQIDPMGKGYLDTPGIHNEEQVKVWKEIVGAVHEAGGKIFCQLWHVGRISHNSLLPEGEQPIAPSAITAQTQTFTATGFTPVSIPRELEAEELPDIVKQYQLAAKNAIDAGFDGIEIHAANGYLLNQFLSPNSNHRTDDYGGSPEKRVKFPLLVLDGVIEQIGTSRVGVRVSPTGKFNDINDTESNETYSILYNEIDKRNCAYLHCVERFPGMDVSHTDEQLVKQLRTSFKGNYIANGNYDSEKAQASIEDGAFAVAFGRPFISNPDLAERIKQGIALTPPNHETFYGGNEKGYTDYPFASAKK